jgi:demethylmacrocin O-methyltransferase
MVGKVMTHKPDRTPLCKLALKWTTDKAGDHEYTRLYYELFRDKRESVRKVLEIGIGYPECMKSGYRAGASVYMWEEFFPNATIYALDIREDLLINRGRIKSFQCDQSNADSMKEVLAKIGGDFDLIVDDGSHIPEHQILSAQVLAHALAPGGVYVVEDLMSIEPEVITAHISAQFTCESVLCPSPRGQEKIILIRHAVDANNQ